MEWLHTEQSRLSDRDKRENHHPAAGQRSRYIARCYTLPPQCSSASIVCVLITLAQCLDSPCVTLSACVPHRWLPTTGGSLSELSPPAWTATCTQLPSPAGSMYRLQDTRITHYPSHLMQNTPPPHLLIQISSLHPSGCYYWSAWYRPSRPRATRKWKLIRITERWSGEGDLSLIMNYYRDRQQLRWVVLGVEIFFILNTFILSGHFLNWSQRFRYDKLVKSPRANKFVNEIPISTLSFIHILVTIEDWKLEIDINMKN